VLFRSACDGGGHASGHGRDSVARLGSARAVPTVSRSGADRRWAASCGEAKRHFPVQAKCLANVTRRGPDITTAVGGAGGQTAAARGRSRNLVAPHLPAAARQRRLAFANGAILHESRLGLIRAAQLAALFLVRPFDESRAAVELARRPPAPTAVIRPAATAREYARRPGGERQGGGGAGHHRPSVAMDMGVYALVVPCRSPNGAKRGGPPSGAGLDSGGGQLALNLIDATG
jgi:hypothetical protein